MQECLQRRPVSQRIHSVSQESSADSEVIYLILGDGRYGQGYAAAKRYIVRAVCAVGMTQPGAQEKVLRERNGCRK